MAAEVNGQGAGFQVNNARELFDARARGANIAGYGVGRQYDVSSDGRRFLVSAAVAEESSSGAVTLVVNWTAGLAK